jgi:tetratricopeptide (TPR) repeat protein
MKLASSALCVLDEVLERTASTDTIPAHEAFLEAARLNSLLGRFQQAAERCAQALRTASDKEQELNCLIELGTILRESGHLTEARETFNKAITDFDAPPWTLIRPYYELGLTERALGKLAEARAKIRKAVDILQSDPELPRGYMSEALRVTGGISYDLGDFEAAAASFREAVDSYPATDPLHWNCLLWLARCQCDLGQFDGARRNARLVEKCQVASDSDREDAGILLREIGPV